jgi:hypothetical protein
MAWGHKSPQARRAVERQPDAIAPRLKQVALNCSRKGHVAYLGVSRDVDLNGHDFCDTLINRPWGETVGRRQQEGEA